jgi:hypothetical protein
MAIDNSLFSVIKKGLQKITAFLNAETPSSKKLSS